MQPQDAGANAEPYPRVNQTVPASLSLQARPMEKVPEKSACSRFVDNITQPSALIVIGLAVVILVYIISIDLRTRSMNDYL